MVAQHRMLTLYICSFVIFQGIRTSIALETLYFCDFSTGGGGGGGVHIHCLRWRSSIVKKFSIAAYPVLEGTHNLVVVYMIVKWWKILNVSELVNHFQVRRQLCSPTSTK